MNISSMFYAFFLMIIAVFSVAASSIGIQCYSDKEKGTNYNFLIANLVMALLLMLSAFGSMAVAFNTPSYASY